MTRPGTKSPDMADGAERREGEEDRAYKRDEVFFLRDSVWERGLSLAFSLSVRVCVYWSVLTIPCVRHMSGSYRVWVSVSH